MRHGLFFCRFRAGGDLGSFGVGAGGLLGVFFAVLVVWKILRGPRCVGRAGGLAALTRCGSVSGARCARVASGGKLDLSTGWLYLAVVASECSGGSGIRIPHIRNF